MKVIFAYEAVTDGIRCRSFDEDEADDVSVTVKDVIKDKAETFDTFSSYGLFFFGQKRAKEEDEKGNYVLC